METRALKPYVPHLTVIAAMILTCAALYFGVNVHLVDEPGIRKTLPMKVGEWSGHAVRYCHNPSCGAEITDTETQPLAACPRCGQALFPMSLVEYGQLPRDTEYLKARYTNARGDMLYVSVVLSGQERNSIHPAQACLVGQGNEIVRSQVRFIPLAGKTSLSVMVLDIMRHGRGPDDRPFDAQGYYAYWFVGQGRETPYHLERMFWLAWDRVFHGVAHRWAYIAVMGTGAADADSTQTQFTAFVQALHPQLVLPQQRRGL
jgi:hypothetical protein